MAAVGFEGRVEAVLAALLGEVRELKQTLHSVQTELQEVKLSQQVLLKTAVVPQFPPGSRDSESSGAIPLSIPDTINSIDGVSGLGVVSSAEEQAKIDGALVDSVACEVPAVPRASTPSAPALHVENTPMDRLTPCAVGVSSVCAEATEPAVQSDPSSDLHATSRWTAQPPAPDEPHAVAQSALDEPVPPAPVRTGPFTACDAFCTIRAPRTNGLCVVSSGRFLVACNQREHCIDVYDLAGVTLDGGLPLRHCSIGGHGSGPGEFSGPRKLCAAPRVADTSTCTILVADYGNNRVQEVAVPSGQHVRDISVVSPHGVAASADTGMVAVSQPPVHSIYLFHYVTGQLHRVVDCGNGQPAGVTFCNAGSAIITVLSSLNAVVQYAVTGSDAVRTLSSSSCGLKEPRDVVENGEGEVMVADTGNNRLVRVHVGSGKSVGSIGYGVFKAPAALCFDAYGRLFVGHGGAAKVSLLTPVT